MIERCELSPKTLELIEKFGNQAYHKAVEFVVMATNLNDKDGAKMFAEAAKELMQKDYHKNTKV